MNKLLNKSFNDINRLFFIVIVCLSGILAIILKLMIDSTGA